ncbi:hypothetical protein QQS21_012734 [Conoideocrella luteorostrata]|uniref:Uncharacterized protein n=1 Tax=Conoideocrella luteorostrata TaxID=1105319 RepID=A0AAJ0CAL7_9HYPO|nr:hypothetical protein QQS21_012734 [Conoideocrella luteorostrata]
MAGQERKHENSAQNIIANERRANYDEFFFEIADWIKPAVEHVCNLEDDLRATEEVRLFKFFKAKGMTRNSATKMAIEYNNWKAIHGQQTTDILQNLMPEINKVELWKRGGKKKDDAPSTPFLDRIKVLCDKSCLISRRTFIYWIDVQNERHQMAHDFVPVPRNFFCQNTGRVDFSALKKAIFREKLEVRQRHDSGTLINAQFDMFNNAIQSILNLYFVDVRDNANARPTSAGLVEETRLESIAGNNPPPPVDYPDLLNCDWDDLDL